MSEDPIGPEVAQSVNHELDWLRDVYRIVDPRFNRINREALERALVGLEVAHLSFVRDLNSVILEDQLAIFGGRPESYDQISLYTDYIVVDDFVTHLIDEAGTNPAVVPPETRHGRRPSRPRAKFDRGFTWDPWRHTTEDARRTGGKRWLEHYVSRPWRRSSIRRFLKILLVVCVFAFVEQGLERHAPEPYGAWTRNMRRETVSWYPAARWWNGNLPEWDIVAEAVEGKALLLREMKWTAQI